MRRIFAMMRAGPDIACFVPAVFRHGIGGGCWRLHLAGKRIYRDGLLPSGAPLRGMVQNGVELSGGDAACAKCHRRSGLGGGEGQNTIRPIAGRLLFSASGNPRFRALPRPVNVDEIREPYTRGQPGTRAARGRRPGRAQARPADAALCPERCRDRAACRLSAGALLDAGAGRDGQRNPFRHHHCAGRRTIQG